MKCQKIRPYIQYFAGMTIIMDITLVLMRVGWNGTECATLALHQTFHFFLIRIITEKSRSKHLSTMRPTFQPRNPVPSIEQFSYQALVYQVVAFLLFPIRNRIFLGLNLISLQGALPERDVSSFCWNTGRSQGNVLQKRGLSSYTLFGAYLV